MEYKNQHWITESYLKAWCDPSTSNEGAFVWVVAKNSRKLFTKAPRSLFSETDFYTAYDQNGKRVLDLEHELKKIEDKFVLLRDRKIQKHEPLSNEDRITLALFVSSMYARTKRQKEEGKEIWQDYIKMVDELPPYLSSTIKQTSEYKAVVDLHSGQPMLFHMFNFVNITAPYLHRMNYAIYETNLKPGIITSDNPCFWFDPNIYNPNTPKPWFGLGSPTLNIMFPISPKQYLSLEKEGPDGYFDLAQNPNQEEMIDLINGFIATNCEEYIVISQKKFKEKWFDL